MFVCLQSMCTVSNTLSAHVCELKLHASMFVSELENMRRYTV